VQSITAAHPRTPTPGWGTAPPGSPLCPGAASPAVSRGSAYLRRGAAARCSRRCRPLLPAAPGGVWAARSSRSLGRADRAVPANQDREASRRLSPQPCGAWRGAASAALSLPPPTSGSGVVGCWKAEGAPRQPLSMAGYGWGALFGTPPQPTTALLHLCAGWKGWWIPIAMGTWHFACQPAAFPGNVGLFCWERRVVWMWEEELGLGSAGGEKRFPFPKSIEVTVLTSAACTNSLKNPELTFVKEVVVGPVGTAL